MLIHMSGERGKLSPVCAFLKNGMEIMKINTDQ